MPYTERTEKFEFTIGDNGTGNAQSLAQLIAANPPPFLHDYETPNFLGGKMKVWVQWEAPTEVVD